MAKVLSGEKLVDDSILLDFSDILEPEHNTKTWEEIPLPTTRSTLHAAKCMAALYGADLHIDGKRVKMDGLEAIQATLSAISRHKDWEKKTIAASA